MIDGRGTRTARYWQTLVRHVHDDSLAHGEIIAQLLVRHRGAHQLAVGVLAVFPAPSSTTVRHAGCRRDGAVADSGTSSAVPHSRGGHRGRRRARADRWRGRHRRDDGGAAARLGCLAARVSPQELCVGLVEKG